MKKHVELILILITLAVGVSGTLSNQEMVTKVLIVILLMALSFVTYMKNKETGKENEVNKRLIIRLVSASKPSADFNNDIVKDFNLMLDDCYVSSQSVGKNNNEITLQISSSDGVKGYLYLSPKDVGELHYENAAYESMQDTAKSVIDRKWNDINEHWKLSFDECRAFSHKALSSQPGLHLIQVSGDNSSHSFLVEFALNNNKIDIVFEKEFLESLYDLQAVERGLLMFTHASNQLKQQA